MKTTKILSVFLLATAIMLAHSSAFSATKIIRPAPKKPFLSASNSNNSGIKPLTRPTSINSNDDLSKPVTGSSGRAFSASLVTKDPAIRKRTIVIGRNDSFVGVLLKLGFNQRQISSLTTRLAREGGFVANSARTGQQIIVTEKVEFNKRKILALEIPTDKYNVKVSKSSSGQVIISRTLRQDAPANDKTQYFYKAGTIQTTIAGLGNSLGVPSAVTAKAIRVLSGKVNVSQSRRGDRLEMLYEFTYNNAGARTGMRLLYVSLLSKGVRTEGFRFSPDARDTGEFFDTAGVSFTKSMLASPLRGHHKITSGFGYRRHPILGRRLLHSGVDFGGRRGEPIYAAGDGTIDKFGRYGGYGNYIRIKHDNTWSTAYGHMSGYARGMYKWRRVKKGELIGYIGSTGRSTGNHLHFELIRNGTPIDPLKAKLPVGGKKLFAKELYRFKQEVGRIRGLVSRYKR